MEYWAARSGDARATSTVSKGREGGVAGGSPVASRRKPGPLRVSGRGTGSISQVAAKRKRDGAQSQAAIILQDSSRRGKAALQDDVEIAVAVNVGNRESAGIIGEVEAADARKVIEMRRSAGRRCDTLIENVRLASA